MDESLERCTPAGEQADGGSLAESLFAAWMGRRALAGGGELDDGEASEADFEALRREHPDVARELAELRSAWRRLRAIRDAAALGDFSSPHADVPSAPALAPGLVRGRVVGDFRLARPIGRGGMGEVWEAEQLSLGGRRVAMKFVRPERVTARQLELFAREARAGGRLSHPGIVSVFGHGESDGLWWIAMELVPGALTLRDLVDERTRAAELPRGYDLEVARLIAEVAEAMQSAHAAGVVHRDLKPQNVLLTPERRPKVTDFGLARVSGESALSQSGGFAGTYYYASPEQVTARRGGIDHRSDVFSLGVVLYELLTLRRPFEGDTTHQVAEQILSKEPADPRAVRSRIPRELAVIAGKALEKDRERRYPSMAELAADLRRFLAGEPIRATPPTRADRTLKWVRRNRAKSAAAALAGLFFAVILGLLAANVSFRRELARTVHALEVQRDELERTADALQVTSDQAQDAATLARQRMEEVLRLSDLKGLRDLEAEAESLWPAHPDRIGCLDRWRLGAAELVDRLPEHRAVRDKLRDRALPRTEEDRRRDRAARDREREQALMRGELETPDRIVRVLSDVVGRRRTWRFEMPEDQWQHHALSELVEGIERLEKGLLADENLLPGQGWSVPKRLRFARELDVAFAPGGAYERAWTEALPAIRAAHPGLDLSPQMGLLPIGPDPDSGLFEFAHLMTGEPAARAADGRLRLTPDSGLVLVLLPGGRFWMGAQSSDSAGRNYDPAAHEFEGPVREVALSAFFLSKYEMSRGQWRRLAGELPSGLLLDPELGDRVLLDPVDLVSWLDCVTWLPRAGLELPSEAQWEYAARGGTETPWWTGRDRDSLAQRRAANLADRSLARVRPDLLEHTTWPELDDGYALAAPIGALAANPFGLHHVHGNVSEWCADAYVHDFLHWAPELDPRASWDLARIRSIRGGSFREGADRARSAQRTHYDVTNGLPTVGLRPARAIDPPR